MDPARHVTEHIHLCSRYSCLMTTYWLVEPALDVIKTGDEARPYACWPCPTMPKSSDSTLYFDPHLRFGPQSQHTGSPIVLENRPTVFEYLPNGHSHPVDWGASNAYSPDQALSYDTVIPSTRPNDFFFHPNPTSAEGPPSQVSSNSEMAMAAERQELISNPRLILQLLPHEQQESLRQILSDILATSWWRHNEPEPEGTFTPFIERLNNHKYKCTFCHTVQSRMDRAVAHCRKHLHHRPFYCNGERCRGGGGACGSRFFTRECLTAHRKHNKQTCSVCAAPVEEKNMNRHKRSQRCSRSTAFRQTSSGIGLDPVWNSMVTTDVYLGSRSLPKYL